MLRSREVKLAKQMQTQFPLEDVKKCCLTDCGRSLFQRQVLHWKRRADHSKSIKTYSKIFPPGYTDLGWDPVG